MILSELIDKLSELDAEDDPEVYIRLGLLQVHAEKVEYFPETDYEWSAVVIS